MNHSIALLAILVISNSLLGNTWSAEPSSGNEQDLFNSEDLGGWDYFLIDPNSKMSDVWSVQDGILICQGEPMGYLYTNKDFKNFKLTVEWRWAPETKPGNSGVLMRITGKSTMLPNCVEAQLASGSAGDMYGFQGFKIDGNPSRKSEVHDHDLAGHLRALGKIEGNEKEPGQWNKYEITANGDNITLVVNGKQVNEATSCDVRAGKIGLQSEGGEIHFRTVKLASLDKKGDG